MAKKKGKENEIKEPVTNCDQFEEVAVNNDSKVQNFHLKQKRRKPLSPFRIYSGWCSNAQWASSL